MALSMSQSLGGKLNSAEPENLLLRAVLNRKGYDRVEKAINPPAFMRRPPNPKTGDPRDLDGLSVSLASGGETVDKLVKRWTCYAVCSLFQSGVESIDVEPRLGVVPDSDVHANITGLPASGENDRYAEYLANELIRISKLEWP